MFCEKSKINRQTALQSLIGLYVFTVICDEIAHNICESVKFSMKKSMLKRF